MRRKRRKTSVEYAPQKKKQKIKKAKVPANDRALQLGATVTTRADASATASLPSSKNANLSVQEADAMTTVDTSETASLSSSEDCNAPETTAATAIAIDVSKADRVSSSKETNSDPQGENLAGAEAELEVETSEAKDSVFPKVPSVLYSAGVGIGTFFAFLAILCVSDNILDLIEEFHCFGYGHTRWLGRFTTMGSPMCRSMHDIQGYLRTMYAHAWMCGLSGSGIWLAQHFGRKFLQGGTPRSVPQLAATTVGNKFYVSGSKF